MTQRLSLVAAMALPAAVFAQFAVTSTTPPRNSLNVPRGAGVAVTFDRSVNPATFVGDNFWLFSRWGGLTPGAVSFSNGNQTATFTPTDPFHAGDSVMVILSHDLRGADGSFLRTGGYSFTFTTAVTASTGTFTHLQTFSDRSANNAQTRIYGGLACDLNRDRWLDLTMINEVSADLRVFLNRADGSGLFQPFLTPETPIPFESSPNEPGDFNRDGFIDIITTSNATNQLTIAFGRGDGTFNPPTIINMPSYPRGNAVLDFDGDGDLDIVVANVSASLSLLTNNGSGGFAAPVSAVSGGSGPYGLITADMNNDGLMDLVVGHTNSQTATVLRGNGNASFTVSSTRAIGGEVWVIAAGDVNGDGNIDIVSANSGSANGTLLLGNGNGTLQPFTSRPTSGHTVGTELADYDGDGDLDWLIACYGGGRWHRFENNGAGVMTQVQEFIAPANPACSVSADFDNDGDLDIALLDEIADVIILQENVNLPATCDPDFNCDGNSDQDDVACIINVVAGNPGCQCQDPDFTGDGNVDQDDVAALISAIAGGGCP